MKKTGLLILLLFITCNLFSQELRKIKALGSYQVGNKEVTVFFDDLTKKRAKSTPHSIGLFKINEIVQIEILDKLSSKIIKPNLNEDVFISFQNDLSSLTLKNQVNRREELDCPYVFLQFNSLEDFQSVHRVLNNEFVLSNEDEEVLINYELQNDGFYSLRMKDFDITEGNVEDYPSFDPTDYTSDLTLQTLLNSDGIVQIGEFLYIWSDGGVIHRILGNDCNSYLALLYYIDLIKVQTPDYFRIQELKNNHFIEDISIISDPRFDVVSITETGIKIDYHNSYSNLIQKNACGVEVHMGKKIVSMDLVNKELRILLNLTSASPVGTNVISTFTIANASDYYDIKIVSSSNMYSGSWPGSYVGNWVEIRVNFSNYEDIALVPDLKLLLTGVINPFSSNSCMDTDAETVSFECPLVLNAKVLNYGIAQYEFSIEGLEAYGEFKSEIKWTFGDGSVEYTTTPFVTHEFLLTGCGFNEYVVSAEIVSKNGGLNYCRMNFYSSKIFVGNPCHFGSQTNKKKFEINGKKVKLIQKIKKRSSLFGGTKFVNKFFGRISGTKSISNSGSIKQQIGNSCVGKEISNILPSVSQDGKKSLKQKYKSGDVYFFDANNPYSTTFTHSSGFTQVLTFAVPCVQ